MMQTPGGTPVRILMLSVVDPRVVKNGAATVTRNLIRLLETFPGGADVDCLPVALPPSRFVRRARQARSVARSFFSALPAKPAFTYSRDFRRQIAERLRRTAFDLIVLNGSDLLWTAPLLPAATPRLLVAHNIEHQLLASQLETLGRMQWWLGPLARREQARMERFETEGMRAVGNVVFLSCDDAAHARERSLVRRSVVLPPVFFGPPCDRSSAARRHGSLVAGFLADLSWWPNREGLLWFLSRVLPHAGGLRVHLFGPDTERAAAGYSNVTGHGPVEDLERVWKGCDILLCPTLRGGGVRVKVAEGVYHGIPILATAAAARGLPLDVDPAITILDDATEWARFLNTISPQELRNRRIPPALSLRFDATRNQAALHGLLRQILGTGPKTTRQAVSR